MLIALKTVANADTGTFNNQLTSDAARISSATTVEQAINDPVWQRYIQGGIDRTNRQVFPLILCLCANAYI